jgi:hypothetical protein
VENVPFMLKRKVDFAPRRNLWGGGANLLLSVSYKVSADFFAFSSEASSSTFSVCSAIVASSRMSPVTRRSSSADFLPTGEKNRPSVARYFFSVPGHFFSREKNFFSQEKNFFPQERDFFSQEKNLLPQEKNFLPQEKNFFPQERDFLSQEKNLLSQEKNLLSQEKNFFPREKNSLCGEKTIHFQQFSNINPINL